MFRAAAVFTKTAGLGGARLLAPELVPCALLELYGRQSSVTAESAALAEADTGPRPTKKQRRAQKVSAALTTWHPSITLLGVCTTLPTSMHHYEVVSIAYNTVALRRQ